MPIMLTLLYAVSADHDLPSGFTDTRIITVPHILCRGLQLEVQTPYRKGYTASLSMLDAPPTLSGHESFAIHKNLHIGPMPTNTHYFFYLYPGSKVTIQACIVTGKSEGIFHLVKGAREFKRWGNGAGPSEGTMRISSWCDHEKRDLHTFSINLEDYYYLVFYSGDYSLSNTINLVKPAPTN